MHYSETMYYKGVETLNFSSDPSDAFD